MNRTSRNPINWVVNGLKPNDLRTDKPIPTSRYVSFNNTSITEIPSDWRRPVDLPAQFFSRHQHQHLNNNEACWRMFCPALTCREWSTLREMSSPNLHQPHDGASLGNGSRGRPTGHFYNSKRLLPSQCRGRHPQTYSNMTK